jgi:hypothetical protein
MLRLPKAALGHIRHILARFRSQVNVRLRSTGAGIVFPPGMQLTGGKPTFNVGSRR